MFPRTNPRGEIRGVTQQDLVQEGTIVFTGVPEPPQAQRSPELKQRNAIFDTLEEWSEQSYDQSLVERIKDEYAGEGLVAVDRETEDVIATAPTSHELAMELMDRDYDESNTLIIRCNEST